MSDLNSYSFTGRLGNPAELKYTASGTAIWTASIGVGYGYGDNKGTNWIRVQVFGKRAESLGKLDLDKGAAVGITGELRVRQYETRDGNKGTSVEVVAQDVVLLGKRQDSGNGTPRQNAPTTTQRPQRATDEPRGEFVEDDIPFITAHSRF